MYFCLSWFLGFKDAAAFSVCVCVLLKQIQLYNSPSCKQGLSVTDLPCSSSHLSQDASEPPQEHPLHRAGELSVLACARAQRDPLVHLWADPSVSEGESVHHRRIQSTPAIKTLHQKVHFFPLLKLWMCCLLFTLYFSYPTVYSFCPMRRWTSGVIC